MYYESGIIYCDCIRDPTDVTHEVVIIGSGLDGDGDSYWILRNSWSDDWGEKGDARITAE